MRTILFVSHLILLAFLGTSVSAQTLSELLDQHALEMKALRFDKDCGPISFFNAMILAPKNLKKSILTLPGKTNDDRYRSLMRFYGTKPSRLNPSLPRYQSDLGISFQDLADMANDLIAGQNARFAMKAASDSKSSFITTLNDLNSSITKGFAPVLALTFQSSDPSKTSVGHAVMLIQIMSVDETQKKAVLKILDPDGFNVTLMQVAQDSKGLLESSAQGIWPADLPAGLMLLDSYIILEN